MLQLRKEGKLKGHKDVTIMDFTVYLFTFSLYLEEVVARNYLINERLDAIINIMMVLTLKETLSFNTDYETGDSSYYGC